MNNPNYAVILAGGKGLRLWPLSRRNFPKQFLPLGADTAGGEDGQTLLQAAYARAVALVGAPGNVVVLSQSSQADLVRSQLPRLERENLILEPVGRNTAACLGLAALTIRRWNEEAVMAVLPADHLFRNVDRWIIALQAALGIALETGQLVAVGIPVQSPSINYGYLLRGSPFQTEGSTPAFAVDRFIEKPDIATAKTFFQSGSFLWNTGTYAWKISAFLQMLASYLPDTYQGLCKIIENPGLADSVYPALPDISIDYGVMEKASGVVVVQGDFERIDIGSLANFEYLMDVDDQGNAARGDNVCEDSRNNLVYTDDGMVGLFGVENLVVIRRGEVVFVCAKERLDEIKKFITLVEEQGLSKYL